MLTSGLPVLEPSNDELASIHIRVVTGIYRQVWGRIPTADELSHWLDILGDEHGLADFLSEMSGLPVDAGSARGVVDAACTAILGRIPVPAPDWLESAERDALSFVEELLAHPLAREHRARHMSASAARLYRAVLGRHPRAEELDHWAGEFARGAGLGELIDRLDAGSEKEARLRERRRKLVQEAYGCILKRGAVASDYDAWEAEFQRGLRGYAFFAALSLSPEARSQGLTIKVVGSDDLANAITAAYRVYVDREPSEWEVDFWAKHYAQTEDFLEIAEALKSSSEADVARRNSQGEAIRIVYSFLLGRDVSDAEIQLWLDRLSSGASFDWFVRHTRDGAEAKSTLDRQKLAPALNDAQFISEVYNRALSRGAAASEIEHWVEELSKGHVTRSSLLTSFFNVGTAVQPAETNHDSSRCAIMGTSRVVTVSDWDAALLSPPDTGRPPQKFPRFHIKSEPHVLVSAIASLYRGEKYIQQFLDNICAQSVFNDYAELIVIDADSPEDELPYILKSMESFPNIRYIPIGYRIGIYDAWNLGIEQAKGSLITNTNLDDLRRLDSLELQAGTLESLRYVDVVYQEFYYSFDWKLPFDEVSRVGFRSALPEITANNMFRFNSPHNAPMWRKSLHQDVGLFDTAYKSAGDYEFWMRCLAADKVFYKLNDPHVSYYHNPAGLSTRAESVGIQEANAITRKYGRIFSERSLFESKAALISRLGFGPAEAGLDLQNATRFEIFQNALLGLTVESMAGRE